MLKPSNEAAVTCSRYAEGQWGSSTRRRCDLLLLLLRYPGRCPTTGLPVSGR